MNNRENQVIKDKSYVSEFVLAAISVVTETIRFIDTKVGAIFLLYGFIIAGLLEAKDNIYRTIKLLFTNGVCYGNLLILLLFVFLIFSVSSIIYSMLTILPRINPSKAVVKEKFTDSEFWYISSMSEDKKTLNTTLEKYSANLLNQDFESIVKCQAFELLKLSYIRNKKIEYFNKSFTLFMFSLLAVTVVAIITVLTNVI